MINNTDDNKLSVQKKITMNPNDIIPEIIYEKMFDMNNRIEKKRSILHLIDILTENFLTRCPDCSTGNNCTIVNLLEF